MEIKEALIIVLNLAEQNALDEKRCDIDLLYEAMRQKRAIRVVRNFLKSKG